MCSKEYNGYANYETWLVSLWLDNDQGLYNMIRDEMIPDAIEGGKDRMRIAYQWTSTTQELKHYVTIELADALKELVENDNPLADSADLYSDLINAALSEVDYYDIAENYLDDVDIDDEDDDQEGDDDDNE